MPEREQAQKGKIMNLCDDNRIITIEKAKQAMIKGTNIEDSPEEMKVLDSFLLRCWQMGWLDRYAPTRHFNAMPKVISERMAAGHGSNVPMQPNIPPMPSNTSNALDALVDAYKGRSNALENQTKWNRMMLHLAELQLTYSPDWGANGQGDQKLYDFVTELIDEFSGWDVPDTNVRDTISRQAAIKALDKRFDSIPMEQTTAILLLRRDLRELPPTQPELIEKEAYIRGFEQGRTQGMIDSQSGKR
jgi:hypothetical protein